MSNQQPVYTTLRVFNETRVIEGKEGKRHGFQTCGIVKGEGRVEEFEQYFDANKATQFLPAGDYEAVSTGMYLDRNGRLQMGREFRPLKQAA